EAGGQQGPKACSHEDIDSTFLSDGPARPGSPNQDSGAVPDRPSGLRDGRSGGPRESGRSCEDPDTRGAECRGVARPSSGDALVSQFVTTRHLKWLIDLANSAEDEEYPPRLSWPRIPFPGRSGMGVSMSWGRRVRLFSLQAALIASTVQGLAP